MAIPRRFLPSMNLLAAFEAAARHQSFTNAARELNLTQSAVSRQIRLLEEILGADLFVRERQMVRLTTSGEVYAREVRQALQRISGATLGFRANPHGLVLNLEVLPTFAARWLIPRLPDFRSAHPEIQINLFSPSPPFDFAASNADAAIHFGTTDWRGVEFEPLMGEAVLPVCSPDFARRHAISQPEDLVNLPLLHLVSRPDAWERWFEAMQVPIPDLHGMLLDQFSAIAQAAAAGLGVALLPAFLVDTELANGDLVLPFASSVASGGGYYLVWLPSRTDYLPLRMFRAWLVSMTSNPPAGFVMPQVDHSYAE
jgi:LysR family transcriptional regulator, glycine cleavage system transcriptional activator